LRRYDGRGREVEVHSLGFNGRAQNLKAAWARRLDDYDGSGKLARRRFWRADPEGRLHLYQVEDGPGRILESASYTAQGRPGPWPAGHHRLRARFDERGNRLEEAFFGPDGKPMVASWGFHRFVARYDSRNRKVEQAHFGVRGEPAFRADD